VTRHDAAEAPILWTPARRVEVARIALVGTLIALFWKNVLSLPILLAGVLVGVYPLPRSRRPISRS
jgi:hypothetical protein